MIADDPPDPERTFSDEETARLTASFLALSLEVHTGAFSDRPLRSELIRELHHRIFAGVRDHAGRTRSQSWGSDHLTFGPHRSEHRRDIDRLLQELFEEATRAVRSCEDNQDDPGYEAAAFRIAVWTHARLIRIHPFEDGNGRTSRVLLNLLLVRLGLRPIAVELPKQEYIALLNDYFETRNIRPLLDGLLRLAGEQLPHP